MVVVLASLLLVVLSEGVLMIGFTGPVAVAAAVVVEAVVVVLVVVDGTTATLVDEKTASFCAAAGGAPAVLAPVFLAESCMALVVSFDAPLGPASRGVTSAGSNRSTTSAVAAVAVVVLALSTTSATHSSTGFTASIVALVAVELPDLVSFSIFFSSLASNFSSPFFSALANFASSFSSFDEVAVVVEDFEDLDDDLEESLRTWGNRAVKLSSEFELKLE